MEYTPECSASPTALHAARVNRVEAWVRMKIAGHDFSHDWFHVERVTKMAAALAQEEGLSEEERQLAQLAALLHDVADHKYSPDPEADRAMLAAFLAAELALSPAEQAVVLHVIDNMGFKEELARRDQQQQKQQEEQQGHAVASGQHTPTGSAAASEQRGQQAGGAAPCTTGPGPSSSADPSSSSGSIGGSCRERVLSVVQDADRLDAIGAIGIARCLTFGGRFNRVLHNPAVPPRTALSREQYADKAAAQQATTLNHFEEKLLRLKDLMLTDAGRRRAGERHLFMKSFLERLYAEWEAAA